MTITAVENLTTGARITFNTFLDNVIRKPINPASGYNTDEVKEVLYFRWSEPHILLVSTRCGYILKHKPGDVIVLEEEKEIDNRPLRIDTKRITVRHVGIE